MSSHPPPLPPSEANQPPQKDQPQDEEESEMEAIPSISASRISQKLRSLASFQTPSLVSEVKRLASLSFDALRREFEPQEYINKLPIELLGEIFRLCQLHEQEEDAVVPISHLYIASVCRKWRSIVLESPSLWRQILVCDSEPWPRTRTWLERSGTCPLRITMHWTEDENPDAIPIERNTASMFSVMDLLTPHAERWESLSLSVDDYHLMYHALERLESLNAPNIRNLELNHYAQMTDDSVFQPVELSNSFDLFKNNAEGDTPLRDVRLWGVHIKWAPEILSRLCRLTLAYHSDNVRPSAKQFFEILTASAPTLFELNIECSGPAGEDYAEWPSEPIAFPALRELKVAFLPPAYAQNLFILIDAPDLNSLHIDLDEGEDDHTNEWNRVVEVLCTSGYISTASVMPRKINRKRGLPLFPAIRQCTISALPVDTMHLGILLYYHPQISDLTINFNYLSDDLLPSLAEPLRRIPKKYGLIVPGWVSQPLKGILDGSRERSATITGANEVWLLPLLKTFTVYGLEGSALKLITENRMKAKVPLREIYYSDGTSIKSADRAWLTAHLDQFEEFADSDEDDDEEEQDDSSVTEDGDTEDED